MQNPGVRATLVGALVLLGFVAGFWLHSSSGDDATGDSDEQNSPKPSPAGACRLKKGHNWAYDVRSDTKMAIDLGALARAGGVGGAAQRNVSNPREVPTTLTWRLDLQAVDVTKDQALVAVAWSDVKAVSQGARTVGETALSNPALVRLGSNCQVRGVGTNPDTAKPAARVQQAALLSLSFRLPTPGQPAPDVIEQVAIGACTVRDTASTNNTEDASAIVVTRRILACDDVRGAAGMRADGIDARTTFTFDDQPWFSRADGRSSFTLKQATTTVATLASQLHVKRADGPAKPVQAGDLDGYSWTLEAAVATPSQPARKKQWPGLGGMAADVALAEFRRLFVSGNDTGIGARRFVRAWLAANPTGAANLLAALNHPDVTDRHRAAVFHSMGRFGGSGARKALVDVLANRDATEGDRARAALALAALPRPDDEVVDALLHAARRDDGWRSENDDAGHSAALAMGMLAKGQRGKNEAVVKRVHDELRKGLSGDDPQRLAESLSAVANSGDERLLEAAMKLNAHKVDEVRARAANTVRLMKPAETEKAVAAWLLREKSPVVLRQLAMAATEAATIHHTSPSSAIIDAAGKGLDRIYDAMARRALIRLLGAHKSDPKAQALLKKAFRRGWDPATKALIGTYLSAAQLSAK